MNQNASSLLARIACATSLVLLFCPPLRSQRSSGREEVRPDEMAELEALALKPATLYPLPGEEVDVTISVQNRATRSEKGVTVALFAGHARVASGILDIAAGETVSLHLSWRPTEEGEVKLTARIDPEQRLVEHNWHDNEISEDVVVVHKPHAGTDLSVSKLEVVKSPSHPTSLHAVVRNNGATAADAPLVLQADSQTVALRLVRIAAGVTSVVDVPLPSTVSTTRLSAEINPRHRGEERRPDDNVIFVDTRSPADLLVSDLTVYAPLFEQGRARQVTVSFRVVNAGSRPVARTFRAEVLPEPVPPTRVPQLGVYSVNINGLPAGGSVYVSQTIFSPVDGFDIRVRADADNVVAEPDEVNNIATAQYRNPASDVGRWASIGPRLTNNGALGAVGRLTAIAIHPTSPSTIYVGAAGSGVWKTTDGGTTSWQPLTDSLPTLSIAAIAIDPSSPSRVYVATPGVGVFRSEDAGASWVQISGNLNAEIDWGLLLVHPTNPNVIYLTSAENIYPPFYGYRNRIELDPDDPAIVYLSFLDTGGGRIYRLNKSSPAPPVAIAAGLGPTDAKVQTLAVDRITPFTLYAGTNYRGVYRGRSFDGGATWSWAPYNNGLPAATNVTDLEVHPVTKVMRAATYGRSAFEVKTGL